MFDGACQSAQKNRTALQPVFPPSRRDAEDASLSFAISIMEAISLRLLLLLLHFNSFVELGFCLVYLLIFERHTKFMVENWKIIKQQPGHSKQPATNKERGELII